MEGAVSPHGGKIMIVLVFMGHDITSVGGSVDLWLLEGMGDCNTWWCFLLERFFLLFYFFLSSFSPIHYYSQVSSGPWLIHL